MPSKVSLLIAAALLAAPTALSRADKLVIFTNGRTMRVVEIRQDAGWSYLTLGKHSEFGVRSDLIAEVRETEGKAGPLPNVQASAGGPSGGSSSSSRGRSTVSGVRAVPSRSAVTSSVKTGGMVAGQERGEGDERLRAARARAEALARDASSGLTGDALRRRGIALTTQAGQRRPSITPSDTTSPSGTTPQTNWPSLLNRNRNPDSSGSPENPGSSPNTKEDDD